ncbi:MAG: hypothetical protein HY341_00970 [Candidatus Kerfeldbacteria bacterium]|nr:hypothetical protein [Candidatus Kerfeldbacteria bacterium]
MRTTHSLAMYFVVLAAALVLVAWALCLNPDASVVAIHTDSHTAVQSCNAIVIGIAGLFRSSDTTLFSIVVATVLAGLSLAPFRTERHPGNREWRILLSTRWRERTDVFLDTAFRQFGLFRLFAAATIDPQIYARG